MDQFNHPNVIRLVGVVTQSKSKYFGIWRYLKFSPLLGERDLFGYRTSKHPDIID